jgi:hypothetical protein
MTLVFLLSAGPLTRTLVLDVESLCSPSAPKRTRASAGAVSSALFAVAHLV